MREVALTRQGLVALVDDDDWNTVCSYRWHPVQGRNTIYAKVTLPGNTSMSMHRLILGLKVGDKRQGDHIDGNGLNNQRHNLRIATRSQNNANRRSARKSSSQFIGVNFNKKGNNWQAQIRHERRNMWIGYFETEVEAAMAYDEAAVKLHGEFANVNFKQGRELVGRGWAIGKAN